MDDYFNGLIFGAVIGALIAILAAVAIVSYDKEDCEKDLPRTQECTLQWVKPEASK